MFFMSLIICFNLSLGNCVGTCQRQLESYESHCHPESTQQRVKCKCVLFLFSSSTFGSTFTKWCIERYSQRYPSSISFLVFHFLLLYQKIISPSVSSSFIFCVFPPVSYFLCLWMYTCLCPLPLSITFDLSSGAEFHYTFFLHHILLLSKTIWIELKTQLFLIFYSYSHVYCLHRGPFLNSSKTCPELVGNLGRIQTHHHPSLKCEFNLNIFPMQPDTKCQNIYMIHLYYPLLRPLTHAVQ